MVIGTSGAHTPEEEAEATMMMIEVVEAVVEAEVVMETDIRGELLAELLHVGMLMMYRYCVCGSGGCY